MPSLDSALTTHAGCTITPHIGGPPYFAALKAKIDALTGAAGDFVYIAGWWLNTNTALGGAALTDLLIAKARAGVDVRVLGWVMAPSILTNSRAQAAPQLRSILGLNGNTMSCINALRAEPRLADKAVLNILAHPAGAVHMKMAVVGSSAAATGFTGGIDLLNSRLLPSWHDVEVQVDGPVVQGLFDTFRVMWNEIRGRSPVSLTANGVNCASHTAPSGGGSFSTGTGGMPDLPARTLATTSGGSSRAQSARTFPRMRFGSVGSIASLGGASIPSNSPLSFAPSGLFEVRNAWEKGIQGAQTFIYIEDQGFTAAEAFDWVNAAVKASDTLKVVVLTGLFDPNDDPNNDTSKFFRVTVNSHLIVGLSAAQLARVGVFSHLTKTIHTKSTVVDDAWAIIGSANAMRRSLYTDLEHSVAFTDDAGGVARYRETLWGVHHQQSIPAVQAGLSAWFNLPFQGAGPPPPRGIVRLQLPLPATTLNAQEQVMYDEVMDADSRQEWGTQLMRLFMQQAGAGSFAP
ncbi:phospholipase D-like domain-containing protein [Deinococcus sp. Arct2-2]|uniref:phospholipase D-like domain-containing protein n=1 Tax=Deinococcus sp. Arct2-2 TaxID=2568653 RepID=UPI001454BB77|nr:phospholipase D-like domain-containing protein [Deinococcus sp. Arct2-2]